MFDKDPQLLAETALRKFTEGDPREARKLLMEALEVAPERPDLIHALGVVHLQLGEAELALPIIHEAVSRCEQMLAARPAESDQIGAMRDGFRLSLAAAHEDLDQPAEAEAAYRRVLADTPGQPRARQALAHLLFARGDLDEANRQLDLYIGEDRDENTFLDGAQAYRDDLERFFKNDIDPRELLVAHRDAYCEMFDHYAREQEAQGWVAEAARMKRDDQGRVVPNIPEGARPYAAVRVDLVDPRSSQVGQVGDQPYVVALADYQALARAPALLPWRKFEFDVRVSTQAPWDQLPISVLFERESGGPEALDAVIGDWYTDGYNGKFGTRDGHRFHYVSDPEPKRGGRGVTYNVDLGRARTESIDDLLRRLGVLHGSHPIRRVHVGRGFLP
ncbi:MAG: tetratricopeptide repeat protein [Deltaproteobacteria bacterium]|nr:tetratricopeptide repeat protein [Deltaproteobacteria bacterium]